MELRKGMWEQIGALRERGTTIILTTHYIEEAELMADRVGIIRKGQILMVDDKASIMQHMGSTEAVFSLASPLETVPESLEAFPLSLGEGGLSLIYRGSGGEEDGNAEVAALTKALVAAGVIIADKDLDNNKIYISYLDQEELESWYHTASMVESRKIFSS